MPAAMRKRAKAPAHAISPTPRARALAHHLSAMLPGATSLRVWLHGPDTPWPHLTVQAADAAGAPVRINRTQALTAARWIIRAHPHAGWQRTRTFDLRTARLDADGGIA